MSEHPEKPRSQSDANLEREIRAERKFPGVDALVAQIRLDIEESRRLLA